MRDILFRGKSLETGIFVYGSLAEAAGVCYITSYNPLINDWNDWQEVDLGTVGQFTGQYDIDLFKIYEGMTVHQDPVLITSTEKEFTGVVKFYDGSWWIDNGTDAVLLFNEACTNKIIEVN